MIQYHVTPHWGVGPVRLGMRREEVRDAFPGISPSPFRKAPTDKHETDAYHDSGLQVFYAGETPTVEYIELSRDSGFEALYRNVNVFSMPAEELVRIICRDSPLDKTDPDFGYSYIFPELDLSLWRPVMPESDDDPEGREFSTIGVGIDGYYSRRKR